MSAESKTMDDTLRETYAAMNSSDSAEPAEETKPVAEAHDVQEIKVKGYTRKKQERTAPDPPVSPPSELGADGNSTDSSIQKPEVTPLPAGWRGAVKEHWGTMPEEVREEILKREADVQKFVSQRGQAAKFGDEIYSEFAPYEAMLRAEGATPQAAVRELLKTAYLLRTATPAQKTNLIADLAQRYGVDIAAIQQGEIQQIDPAVANMQTQIAQLTQYLQQQGTAYQSQEDQRLMGDITSFKSKVSADGSLQHPHFDALIQPIAHRLQTGQASTLEQAYDQEVWANPDTRKSMIAAQNTKRQTEAKAQADAAKLAAQVNVQKRGSVDVEASSKGSIEDTLRAEYKRVMG